MKICHVTSVHPTFDNRIFHKECRTLAQAGHDVTLIAQADWEEKVVDGVRVIGLPVIIRRHQRVGLWRQIVSRVRRLGPDIVHFHDPELLLIAPCFRPAGLIYDCHESYAEAMLSTAWIPPLLRYTVSRLVAILEPTLARWTDAIVVTVDSHAASLRKAKRPIVVLHNFPLLNDFDAARCADGKTIIHLGSQDKVRGCSIIIEAMKRVVERVPEARLLMVGPFYEREFQAEIHRLIAAYHLEKAIVLMGRVPYTDIPRWLAQADVGLIALQDTEKFKTCIPTKLFEYMASRLPVVASDLPPARRFMHGLDCGFLVEPAHPQAYTEAIEYLLSHPTEAKRMAENGRRAVEERYDWGSEAEKLVNLYQEMG